MQPPESVAAVLSWCAVASMVSRIMQEHGNLLWMRCLNTMQIALSNVMQTCICVVKTAGHTVE